MQGYRGAFLWPLLLLHQSAWAAVKVSVPASPIRALPFTDIRLPCNFSDPSKPISLHGLAVTWKKGKQIIAEYYEGFRPTRPGAEMTTERLQVGDASLLLPQLQDSDSGVYTCLVIFTPGKDQGSFELKLEAEPHVVLGSTKVQLAKQGRLTCTLSGFYPRNISVEWLRDSVVMKGSQTSILQDSQNGLYTASSILEFTPSIADADANFSCQVRHQSLKGPFKEDFQLQLQALPVLQVFKAVSKNSGILACVVSGFYPRDIDVRWLQSGAPRLRIQSEPQALANGTFTMESIIRLQETDPEGSYVCQVQHKGWDAPVESTVHWQPEGDGTPCPTPKSDGTPCPTPEGDGTPCPTPQHPQTSGTRGTPHSCPPTLVTSPPSATGTVAIWSWLVFVSGLVLCVVGGSMIYLALKKGKNKSHPDNKSKGHLNNESEECMLKPEKGHVPDNTVL